MTLYSISIQSLRRRKSKTFFLIFGLFLAVASVITLTVISKNMGQNVSKELDEYGANIIITPKSNELSLNYGGLSIGQFSYEQSSLFERDIDKIKEIKNYKNISVISPKLFSVEQLGPGKLLVAGVIFEDEIKLKKWWKLSGKLPTENNQILLGSEVSTKLKLSINDTIKIKNSSFFVSGIIQPTGSQDDDIIFMDMKTAQKLFNKKNDVSLIELAALCYDCPIEEIVRQTSEKLPNAKVSAIRQSIDTKMAAVAKFEEFSFGISLVILIISLLIVFTNVNSSLNERVREIGVFKSIGFKNSDIFKIIFMEVITASLIAGISGYFIGILAAKTIMPLLNPGYSIPFDLNINVFFMATLLSVLVGVSAAFYPAFKATKLDPTVAFRTL